MNSQIVKDQPGPMASTMGIIAAVAPAAQMYCTKYLELSS